MVAEYCSSLVQCGAQKIITGIVYVLLGDRYVRILYFTACFYKYLTVISRLYNLKLELFATFVSALLHLFSITTQYAHHQQSCAQELLPLRLRRARFNLRYKDTL